MNPPMTPEEANSMSREARQQHIDRITERSAPVTPRQPPILRFQMSPTIGKLFGALAKAQKEMGSAVKDAVNPHFKSRYADLASIREAAAPVHAQGIAILQPVVSDGQEVIVSAILGHESGEWLSADCTMVAADNRPQTLGSTITYARRYSLAGILAIASDDDDDGNAASNRGPVPQLPQKETRPTRPMPSLIPKPIGVADPVALTQLTTLMLEAGIKSKAMIGWIADITKRVDLQAEDIRSLPAEDIERCITAAKKLPKAKP